MQNPKASVQKELAARLGDSIQNVRNQFSLDPFTYIVNFLPATASANTDGSFIVQADSAFAICKTSVFVTDTSNAAVAELQPFGSGLTTGLLPFLVTMTDSGSGRSLSNSAVPIDSWFGTAMRPYIFPSPKILDPSSQFQVTIQNLSATDRRVRLSFHGFKIFGNITLFKTL